MVNLFVSCRANLVPRILRKWHYRGCKKYPYASNEQCHIAWAWLKQLVPPIGPQRAFQFSSLFIGMIANIAWAQPTGLELPDLAISESLPITLDATSSEFDRQNNQLKFEGLRIRQGGLRIEADDAEVTRLDFENSVWTLRGNVVIKSDNTQAWCDEADVQFKNHQLAQAQLRGEPARFEQQRSDSDEVARGRASTIDYDLLGSNIKMSENAWLSDGANEVSGARIAYDLERQYIVADGDENGQVRMKIQPPKKTEP